MQQVADMYVNPFGPSQVVAYTGTAGTIANALPVGTQAIWIMVTSIAHIKVSKNNAATAATTTDMAIPASWPVKIMLDPGDTGVKVSAIQSAAGGNLHVTPLQY